VQLGTRTQRFDDAFDYVNMVNTTWVESYSSVFTPKRYVDFQIFNRLTFPVAVYFEGHPKREGDCTKDYPVRSHSKVSFELVAVLNPLGEDYAVSCCCVVFFVVVL
jgi:hypothetical protein